MKSLLDLSARLRSPLSVQRQVVAVPALRHNVIDPLSVPAFKREGVEIGGVSRDTATFSSFTWQKPSASVRKLNDRRS